MPQRQPKWDRLWLGDGSCIRRRAEHRDHVWSYDFVFDRTQDGRPRRTLVVVKEMYAADGNLEGWAVMVKTQSDSAGGQGWYWYEVTSTASGAEPVASGNGVLLCFGCHGNGGNDYVLSGYPLK